VTSATTPLDPLLEGWIRHFRGPLVGFLASRGASWAAAEELAMDTFAEAWLGGARRQAASDDLEAIGGWLRGIAQNLLFAFLRRQRRGPQPLPADEPAVPIAADDDRLEPLRAAFGELRPDFQEVLRMHYLESTSAREVAALLDTTPKAVESRLFQARRALRALADKHLRRMEAHR
jgi:RNA polymerase sigma factor (sigma-70 family)